jgi:hypothetical protein
VVLVQFRGPVPQFLHELQVDRLENGQIEMGNNDINFDYHFVGCTQLYVAGEMDPLVAESGVIPVFVPRRWILSSSPI